MEDKKSIIVCEDGFVWKVLSEEEADKVFDSGVFELYRVDSGDYVDTLIESKYDIRKAFEYGHNVCIEVGFIPKIVGLR